MIKGIINGLPPTLNHTYGMRCIRGRPIKFKTEAAKSYQAEITAAFSNFSLITSPKDRFGVVLKVHQRNIRRDVDAHIKLILDAIADGLGINDNKIDIVFSMREIDKKDANYIEVWFGTDKEIKDFLLSILSQSSSSSPVIM